jgi:SH3-like domain-containing protein
LNSKIIQCQNAVCGYIHVQHQGKNDKYCPYCGTQYGRKYYPYETYILLYLNIGILLFIIFLLIGLGHSVHQWVDDNCHQDGALAGIGSCPPPPTLTPTLTLTPTPTPYPATQTTIAEIGGTETAVHRVILTEMSVATDTQRINSESTAIAASVFATETIIANSMQRTDTPRPTATLQPTTNTPRPTTNTPRSTTNMQTATVYTIDGSRLNLRSNPNTDSRIVAQLSRGAHVTIIGGPRTGSGFTWWNVRTRQGVEGWAVESISGTRTLLINDATISDTQSCTGTSPSLFSSGDQAIVRFNGLRILNDYRGDAGNTIAQLYNNNRVNLLEGPVCHNRANYWRIYYQSLNAYGWIAESYQNERYLCPTRNPNCR